MRRRRNPSAEQSEDACSINDYVNKLGCMKKRYEATDNRKLSVSSSQTNELLKPTNEKNTNTADSVPKATTQKEVIVQLIEKALIQMKSIAEKIKDAVASIDDPITKGKPMFNRMIKSDVDLYYGETFRRDETPMDEFGRVISEMKALAAVADILIEVFHSSFFVTSKVQKNLVLRFAERVIRDIRLERPLKQK